MAVDEVLVSLPPDAGTAAVVRLDDARGQFLVVSVDRPVGGRIEGDTPMIIGTEDGRTVQAGRVPQHASRAVVIAITGDEIDATVERGFYIASIPGERHGPQPVRFIDAAGELVARPAPRGRPMPDASEPCPACGALAWRESNRVAVCTNCGHRESLGYWYGPTRWSAWSPLNYLRRRRVRRERHEEPPVDFPVYAVAGHAPTLAGSGYGGNPDEGVTRQSVKLSHDDIGVAVETSRHDHAFETPEQRARRELASSFDMGEWPDLPPAERSLWIRARRREHDAMAERASVGTMRLTVEGEIVAFIVLAEGNHWAACAELDDHSSIVMSGADIPIETIELGVVEPPPRPQY